MLVCDKCTWLGGKKIASLKCSWKLLVHHAPAVTDGKSLSWLLDL